MERERMIVLFDSLISEVKFLNLELNSINNIIDK